MAGLVAAGTLIGGLVAGLAFGIGIFVGGLFGLVNYLWLDRLTKTMFRGDGLNSGGILAFKYILRYAAIGGVLLLIYKLDLVPVTSVILGLASFAGAVIIQGLRSVFVSSV